MSGDGSVVDPGLLQDRLNLAAVSSCLPLWTEWGVRDEGPLVHSLGCTFLTALGSELGFVAVAEAPAPREGPLAKVEEDVRSDSVWFDRETRRVVLIAEFERYAGKQKDLRPKAESLLLASQRWNCEDAILLLAYWSIGHVSLPDHDSLKEVMRRGYQAIGGVAVPGAPKARILFQQFIVEEGKDGLLRLVNILRRGET